MRRQGHVRGRVPEVSPAGVAVLDVPAQHEGPTEDRVRLVDVAAIERRTHERRTPTRFAEGGRLVEREAQHLALTTQHRHVASPVVPESKVHADEDLDGV